MMISLMLALSAPAMADEPPLAIPAPVRRGTSPQELQAIRKYRSELLSVRNITEYWSSGYYVNNTYGWAPYGGMSVGYAPMSRSDDWVVFRGPARIDVPTYLDTIGHTDDHARMVQRIRRNRRVSHAFYALGGAGLAASIVGLVQMDVANNRRAYDAGVYVSTAGMAGLLTGFIVGSFPASRARALRDYPSTSMPRESVQQDVDAYNERLRVELGLTPDQALRAEELVPQ